MRKAASIGAGLFLAVLCLWLVFRGIDPAALRARIADLDPWLLVLLAGSAGVHMLLRAWRWKALLGAAGRAAPLRARVEAVTIGYAALILPGRVGEVLRPALLARWTPVPFAHALSTVAAERIVLDMPVLVLFGALFLVLPASATGMVASADPALLGAIRAGGALMGIASLVGIALCIAAARHEAELAAWGARWVATRRGLAAKLGTFALGLLPGLAGFRTFGGAAVLGLQSVLVWSGIALGIYAGVRAAGVEVPVAAMLVVIPATALGIAVPTPGGSGSYHLVMVAVLTGLFGADPTAAATAALVCHAVPLVVVALWGAALMVVRGLGTAALAPPDAAAPPSAEVGAPALGEESSR